MRKNLLNGLGALQAFIGISAVAGGLGLALDPSDESLGIPLELLEKTPFASFLVPSIVLSAVNGLGSLAGAIASFTRHRYAGEDEVHRAAVTRIPLLRRTSAVVKATATKSAWPK